jgi:hypothetical protein
MGAAGKQESPELARVVHCEAIAAGYSRDAAFATLLRSISSAHDPIPRHQEIGLDPKTIALLPNGSRAYMLSFTGKWRLGGGWPWYGPTGDPTGQNGGQVISDNKKGAGLISASSPR